MKRVTLDLSRIQDPAVKSALQEIMRASTQNVLEDVAQSGAALVTLNNAAANQVPYFTGLSTVALASPATLLSILGVRRALTVATTFYVATTGSDSNDGLTVGTPWATLQHAYDVVAATLDFNGFTVTIQVADGTYTASGNVLAMNNSWFGGPLVINGNATTPSNVLINASVASTSCVRVNMPLPASFTIQNMKLAATAANCWGIAHFGAGNITTGAMVYGTMSGGVHMLISGPGQMDNRRGSFHNYSIVGNAANHISVGGAALLVYAGGVAVTVSGGLTFASFISATNGAFAGTNAAFSTNVATGQKFSATFNGIVSSFGGGPNFFPGTSGSFTLSTQGQYQ